ncbi:head-tail adaptor protein [Achromobacter pestifer]
MLAYRLRHRVTFQKLVIEQDSEGRRTEAWHNVWLDSNTELADVPAEVLTGPGKELQAGNTTQAETSARINVRWFPAAEEEMAQWRILWDGRVYGIQSMETDRTARREWRLRCIAGPAKGR